MSQLTLQQLFGVNSSQDNQTLTIQKSGLSLTPQINNTAESLLVAILLKALENFQGQLTDPSGNKITDPQGVIVDYNNSNLYETLLIEPWQGYIKERDYFLYVTDTLIIQQFTEYADNEFS